MTRKEYLTLNAFCETEAKINEKAFIKAIQEETDKGLREGLAKIYAEYKAADILRALKNSKVASKPIHYKVVRDFVSAYSTDLFRFYLQSELYCKRICIGFNYNYDFECVYLSIDNETGAINWDDMNKRQLCQILTVAEVKKAYKDAKALNEKALKEFKEWEHKYSAYFHAIPGVGVSPILFNYR